MYVSVDCGSKPGYRWGGQTQPCRNCRKKASHPIGSKPGLGTGCCEATVITTFHLGYLHIHTLFCTFLRLYSVVELAWAVWLTDAGSLEFLGLTESVCKYTLFFCTLPQCFSCCFKPAFLQEDRKYSNSYFANSQLASCVLMKCQ